MNELYQRIRLVEKENTNFGEGRSGGNGVGDKSLTSTVDGNKAGRQRTSNTSTGSSKFFETSAGGNTKRSDNNGVGSTTKTVKHNTRATGHINERNQVSESHMNFYLVFKCNKSG